MRLAGRPGCYQLFSEEGVALAAAHHLVHQTRRQRAAQPGGHLFGHLRLLAAGARANG